MNEILNELTKHSGEILTFLGSSSGLSVFLQGVKKKFNLDDAKKVVVALLTVLSFGGATLQYYLSNANSSALPTVVGRGSVVFASAVLVHRFLVSPTYAKLESYLKPILQAAAQLKAEQVALNQTKPGAAVPDAQAPAEFNV